MTLTDKYWEHISNALEKETGLGHPSSWKMREIENFLFNSMLERLYINFRKNPKIETNLGIDNPMKINTIIPSRFTFRRIFRTRECKGKITVKNLFAYYLENVSYQEYITRFLINTDSPNSELGNNKNINYTIINQTFITINIDYHQEETKESNAEINFDKEHLYDLISKNEVDSVFQQCKKQAYSIQNNQVLKGLILLQSSWNDNINQYNLGIIDHEIYVMQGSKIKNALLDIIDKKL